MPRNLKCWIGFFFVFKELQCLGISMLNFKGGYLLSFVPIAKYFTIFPPHTQK